MKYSSHARTIAMVGAVGTTIALLAWACQAGVGDIGDRLVLAVIFAVPLFATVIGLARHQVRAAGWSAMLAVLYMSHALAEYIVGGGSPGLWLTLFFSSLLFAGCALYPRLRAREGTARKI